MPLMSVQSCILIESCAHGSIDLAAYDRLDVRMLGRMLEKLFHAIHVAMVSDGQSRHAQLFRSFEKLGDGRQSIEDGILCMYVKMDE